MERYSLVIPFHDMIRVTFLKPTARTGLALDEMKPFATNISVCFIVLILTSISQKSSSMLKVLAIVMSSGVQRYVLESLSRRYLLSLTS